MYPRVAPALLTALSLCASPALADTAIGPGVFFSSDGKTAAGFMGSFNIASLPVVPLKLQFSGGVTLGDNSPGGGNLFTTTLELEYQAKHLFAGAGGGIGVLESNDTDIGLYDVFVGARLFPLVSAMVKYYAGQAQYACAGLPIPVGAPRREAVVTPPGLRGISGSPSG